MTVDLTIKVQNGTVTISVGGQPLNTASQEARLGNIVHGVHLGALPGAPNAATTDPGRDRHRAATETGGAANAASTEPGGAPNAASTEPGGGPNEGAGTIVIVPIVITGGGRTAALASDDLKFPASARHSEAHTSHDADDELKKGEKETSHGRF